MALSAQRFNFLDQETNVPVFDFTKLKDSAVYNVPTPNDISGFFDKIAKSIVEDISALFKDPGSLLGSGIRGVSDILNALTKATENFMGLLDSTSNLGFLLKAISSLTGGLSSILYTMIQNPIINRLAYLVNSYCKSYNRDFNVNIDILALLAALFSRGFLNSHCKIMAKKMKQNPANILSYTPIQGKTTTSPTAYTDFKSQLNSYISSNEYLSSINLSPSNMDYIINNGYLPLLIAKLVKNGIANEANKNAYIAALQDYVTANNIDPDSELGKQILRAIEAINGIQSKIAVSELKQALSSGQINNVLSNLTQYGFKDQTEKNNYINEINHYLNNPLPNELFQMKIDPNGIYASKLNDFLITIGNIRSKISLNEMITLLSQQNYQLIVDNLTYYGFDSINEKNDYLTNIDNFIMDLNILPSNPEYNKIMEVKNVLSLIEPKLSLAEMINLLMSGDYGAIINNLTRYGFKTESEKKSYLDAIDAYISANNITPNSPLYASIMNLRNTLNGIQYKMSLSDMLFQISAGNSDIVLSNLLKFGFNSQEDKDQLLTTLSNYINTAKVLGTNSTEVLAFIPLSGTDLYNQIVLLREQLNNIPCNNSFTVDPKTQFLKDNLGSYLKSLTTTEIMGMTQYVEPGSQDEVIYTDYFLPTVENAKKSVELATTPITPGSFTTFDFSSIVPVIKDTTLIDFIQSTAVDSKPYTLYDIPTVVTRLGLDYTTQNQNKSVFNDDSVYLPYRVISDDIEKNTPDRIGMSDLTSEKAVFAATTAIDSIPGSLIPYDRLVLSYFPTNFLK